MAVFLKHSTTAVSAALEPHQRGARATRTAQHATWLGILALLGLLSLGRLLMTAFGYGVPAWFDEEHRALGIPFPSTPDRFDLLEDALEVVKRLTTGKQVSYTGKFVSLENAQMRPLPVQRPHPPLWIGGTGPRRTLPLAARYGDVWHGFGTPNSLRASSDRLDELAIAAGRDPSSILRAGSLSLSEPPDTLRRYISKWIDGGWGYLVCGWPEEGRGRVEEFAADIMPEFA